MSASLRSFPLPKASRPTWDDTWMNVARVIAARSTCSRDQVGAVVVSASNRIIDTGYNGPPAGWQPIHSDGCTAWCPRAAQAQLSHAHGLVQDYSDCYSLHAEANALMFSDRRLREGGTIYVTSGTCSGCAKLVANSGLARAVYATADRDISHRDSARWYDFLQDCGLEVLHYERPIA